MEVPGGSGCLFARDPITQFCCDAGGIGQSGGDHGAQRGEFASVVFGGLAVRQFLSRRCARPMYRK
jgi:hypothetical protein